MALKILFPPPPPTSNSLTPAQRVQLLRTTSKLGRVLGATPHLLDDALEIPIAPLHLHLPNGGKSVGFEGAHHRNRSADSVSSSSTSASSVPPSSPTASLSSCSSEASSRSPIHNSPFTDTPSPPSTWRRRHRRCPPLLRLSLNSHAQPPLETIPASPSHPSYTLTPKPHTTSLSPPHTSHRTHVAPSADSDSAPTFRIPSSTSACTRRAKMERLRRKLGDGVPLNLVFPPSHAPAPSPAPSQSGLCTDVDEIENQWPSTPPALGPAGAGAIQHRGNFVVHYRQSTPAHLHQSPSTLSPTSSLRVPGSRGNFKELCAIVESPDDGAEEVVAMGTQAGSASAGSGDDGDESMKAGSLRSVGQALGLKLSRRSSKKAAGPGFAVLT